MNQNPKRTKLMNQNPKRTKLMNQRIEVSLEVHARLFEFGGTFPLRVSALLHLHKHSPTPATQPVNKPIGERKAIYVTPEALLSLKAIQVTHSCGSLSNTLEAVLNAAADPTGTLPAYTYRTPPPSPSPSTSSNIRVKVEDHEAIREIAKRDQIPICLVIHNLLKDHA